MTDLDELTQLARDGGRRIFVSQSPINLSAKLEANRIHVLELPVEGRSSAGGRIGGIGARRIERLRCFQLESNACRKICEIEDAEKLEGLELPYSATGMSLILPDGTEKVVTGVVDSELVEQYNAIIR